ncbi:phage tail protein [Chromohalobacter israelensis]|uniref:phage tail protein n=1 Tax=Chromohalobacter israelensis TaxID=141390 RepID=UPI000690BC48|nr:phage tail protein [Chromohalobacter israelensis]MDF9433020.1 phage tail protein [Chromohalobacter israelensis]
MVDENSTFGGFLTDIGEAKQSNANALKIPWKLTHMLLGDANGIDPVPDPAQTGLINKRYRAAINQLSIDPANPAILIAELVLPPNVGGWWIRELGLEDEDGDFVAVANCAPSYKPLLAQGSGRNQVVRMHLILSNTANVELKVDPAVVLATRAYVDDEIDAHAQTRNHPDATTTVKGFMQFATLPEHLAGQSANRAAKPSGVAAMIKQSLAAGKYQFAAYNANRTYTTGEVALGSDGVFYEFYDRDLNGEVQGVDPTDSANRPHIWMKWDGVRPGQTVKWRSETLPEGYIVNDGDDYSRSDYRRIFAAFGTTYGAGDGSTTFGVPDDRDEFHRGWDFGASGRSLNEHQSDTFKNHFHYMPTVNGGPSESDIDAAFNDNVAWDNNIITDGSLLNNSSIQTNTRLRTYRAGTDQPGLTGNETRPRNNAVIYLTKI